jgi:outer membrane lipoprotein carrier protein
MLRSLTFAVLALAGTAAVHAQTARSALDRFGDGLVSLEGVFEQQVFNGDGSVREEAKGTVALRAPRLFRWQYDTPYEQLVVADGTHVWLYDVDLEQVTVKRQADQEAQSPLIVLTDPASLDTRYDVTETGERDGLAWLTLKPKQADGEFVQAELGLGRGGLERMHLEDSLGGRTQIVFSAWQRNAAQPADRFTFKPPEGVDVIGDVESVGEVRALPDEGR